MSGSKNRTNLAADESLFVWLHLWNTKKFFVQLIPFHFAKMSKSKIGLFTCEGQWSIDFTYFIFFSKPMIYAVHIRNLDATDDFKAPFCKKLCDARFKICYSILFPRCLIPNFKMLICIDQWEQIRKL